MTVVQAQALPGENDGKQAADPLVMRSYFEQTGSRDQLAQ
jgi:hypothetical protein